MFQLYAAIWRVSGRRQIVLIILSIAVAALAAVPLGFQKEIINGLTDSDVDRARLFLLCGGMMGMILVSLSLKWVLGYRASILGEDVIRMLRTRIYGNAIKAGPDRQAQAGTLATMISAEAEDLGNFTGSAFSEPVVQIGTLVSVIGFIASTQPFLGGIALLMIVPQVILVLSTQGHVNRLVGQRVRVLRHATDSGVATDFEKFDQGVVDEFNKIFDTRRSIFLWKLSTKFLLSSINGAGMVGVLALGGAFVVSGKTDVGTVVAATIGLGRLQGPTGFLIAFYRQVSATRVKYELLRDTMVLPQNRN